MMPPNCCICDAECETDGIVSFRKRPSDEEWDRWVDETGAVGHPPYLAWFCPKHLVEAKKLEHLTIDEAMAKI